MDILYGVIITATLGGIASIIYAARAWLRALSSGESLTGVFTRLILKLGLRTALIVGPAALICPTAPDGVIAWAGHQAMWTLIALLGLVSSFIVERAASKVLHRVVAGAPADITHPADLRAFRRAQQTNSLSLRHHEAVMKWTAAGTPGGSEVVEALDEALRNDITQHATISEYEHAVNNLEIAVAEALDGSGA